jgi:hypothetical protein
MQANKTVTVNGRLYDAVTGLPIKSTSTPSAKKPTAKPAAVRPTQSGKIAAHSLHRTTQRSQTLNRRSTKKPGPTKRPQPGKHMDIARSSGVSRFAAHPVKPAKVEAPEKKDIAPKNHPVAARAMAKTQKAAQLAARTTKQVKEDAIEAALNKTTKKPAKQKRSWKFSRRFAIVSAIFIVLIGAAYLTYQNIPSLSVGVAAAQAGVDATYPEYKPDGYSLSQPVEYSDGEVVLTFTSNSGAGEYTITQTRSSWDSSAVLNNIVRKASGDDYTTTQERGLTIYAFNDNVAWVNGGVLYVIKSDAPLSGEQIRHIATSL